MAERYRLSGAVMTHPRRAVEAERLAARDPAGAFRVVADPEPWGPPTAFRTTMRAWAEIPAGATHHLVLQDDAVPADGFFEHARRTVDVAPDDAVAFYANWDTRNGAAVRMAALLGGQWVAAAGEYTPCVALMLPRAVASGYVGYAERAGDAWSEDTLMHRFLRSAGVRVRLAVPSTVEHQELPSLADAERPGARHAALFGEPSPGSGDGALDLAAIPFFKRGRALCAIPFPYKGGKAWETVGCERFLDRQGVHLPECRDRFAGHLDDMDDAVRALLRRSAPEAAWHVWLTAYAMGVTAGIHTRDPAWSAQDTECAAIDRALDTIAPGGLCERVRPGDLARLRDPLRRAAWHGLVAGGAHDARRSPAPVATRAARRQDRPRTVVTGEGGLLAEHLVRGLADLGHDLVRYGPEPLGHGHSWIEYVPGSLDDAARTRRILGGGGRVLHLGRLDGTDAGPDDTAAAEKALGAGADRVIIATGPGTRNTRSPYRARPSVHTLRFATPYGPGASADGLLARLITGALTGREVEIAAGHPPLSLVHVDDMVRALDAILARLPLCADFAIAQAAFPVRALADIVSHVVRPLAVTVTGGSAAADDMAPMVTAPMVEELGWRPRVAIEDGVQTYAQWLAYEMDT